MHGHLLQLHYYPELRHQRISDLVSELVFYAYLSLLRLELFPLSLQAVYKYVQTGSITLAGKRFLSFHK